MKKFISHLVFPLLLFFVLNGQTQVQAQNNWQVKAEADKVQVRQGKSWITTNSKFVVEQILLKTEDLMKLKADQINLEKKISDISAGIKSFKKLQVLVENKESEIKDKPLAAANASSSKKSKKSKQKNKDKGKK